MAVLDPRTSSKTGHSNKGFADNEEIITLHTIGNYAAREEPDYADDDEQVKVARKVNFRATDDPDTEAEALKPEEDDPIKQPPGTSTLAAKRIILGIMDVALLTSNAGQLRELLQMPYHPFKCFAFSLLMISIALQVAATAFFLLAYWWESEDEEKEKIYKTLRKIAFLAGSFCIFVVLVANIFIAVFTPMNGGYGEPPNGSSSSIC